MPPAFLQTTSFQWNPIEYIGAYAVLRNGQRIDTVRTTSYPGRRSRRVSGDRYQRRRCGIFASEPRSNMPEVLVEFPAAATTMISPEISYTAADGTVNGFNGNGFVEIDRPVGSHNRRSRYSRHRVYSISPALCQWQRTCKHREQGCYPHSRVDGDRKVFSLCLSAVANWDDWGISSTV